MTWKPPPGFRLGPGGGSRWRNEDGMPRSPQSDRERQAWKTFGLHQNGRNAGMDLGDVIAALEAVQEEAETASREVDNAHEAGKALGAQVEAVRQRVESAIGSLVAVAGNDAPDTLGEAHELLASAHVDLASVVETAAHSVEKLKEAYDELATAEEKIGQYKAMLIGG